MFSAGTGKLKRLWIVGISLLLLLAMAAPAMAGPGKREFNTTLRGANEAPGPGDPDGKGKARIRIDPDNSEVCWNLRAKGIEAASAAHIHRAPVGVPGPVVVPLSPPTSGRSSGCTTADPALIMDILQNPQNYYVNVHNAEYPAGAMRGQLGH